jgi:hypothetical protein
MQCRERVSVDACGFSALGMSGHDILERESIAYDALYADCERHLDSDQ